MSNEVNTKNRRRNLSHRGPAMKESSLVSASSKQGQVLLVRASGMAVVMLEIYHAVSTYVARETQEMMPNTRNYLCSIILQFLMVALAGYA